jgi:NADH-quinone oxidoreductase subunit J
MLVQQLDHLPGIARRGRQPGKLHGQCRTLVLVGLVFLVELLLVVGAWVIGPGVSNAIRAPIPSATQVTNTQALGRVLYTDYVHYFELAGIVLLVAMIGAIVLTLQHKPNVKRQNIFAQNARSKASAIEVRKVQPGQGI